MERSGARRDIEDRGWVSSNIWGCFYNVERPRMLCRPLEQSEDPWVVAIAPEIWVHLKPRLCNRSAQRAAFWSAELPVKGLFKGKLYCSLQGMAHGRFPCVTVVSSRSVKSYWLHVHAIMAALQAGRRRGQRARGQDGQRTFANWVGCHFRSSSGIPCPAMSAYILGTKILTQGHFSQQERMANRD